MGTQELTLWTDRLAFDVALTLEGSGKMLEVLEEHSLNQADLLVFNEDPVFLRRVSDYRDEIRQKGLSFRLKARMQAEELLTTSWTLIHAPDVSPAVKADLIKSTVKWGGLEPKENTTSDLGGGVRITINLGEAPQPKVINASVSDDDRPRRFLPEMPV